MEEARKNLYFFLAGIIIYAAGSRFAMELEQIPNFGPIYSIAMGIVTLGLTFGIIGIMNLFKMAEKDVKLLLNSFTDEHGSVEEEGGE